MDLVTPGLGLIVWTTLVFLILVFLLGKFAWKPILNAVQSREEAIDQALKQAEAARADEAVVTQALHINCCNAHASHVRVAPDVIKIVDGEDAREERLQDAHPDGDCCIVEWWL